jgi:hypothetical protein
MTWPPEASITETLRELAWSQSPGVQAAACERANQIKGPVLSLQKVVGYMTVDDFEDKSATASADIHAEQSAALPTLVASGGSYPTFSATQDKRADEPYP